MLTQGLRSLVSGVSLRNRETGRLPDHAQYKQSGRRVQGCFVANKRGVGAWLKMGTFSGNGVLASCVVRALQREGHQVMVFSGMPQGYTAPLTQHTVATELPVWGKLDRDSSWSEYAAALDAATVRRVRDLPRHG
jgi:hypothetical protein